ncbi:MAG: (d)CMP kinase [Burkholderiales bacterium]|jgi:cytidylate kinase|nr:(d)CMP kinase [Burkholderiales bacterium]
MNSPTPSSPALSSAVHSSIPVVTIDGPAASGKGTLAASLAAALGFHLLDSGLFYRMIGWKALDSGVPLSDEAALARLAADLRPRFEGKTEEGSEAIWLEGRELSLALRRQEVGTAASKVAALAGVRAALLQAQREARRMPGLVADGRDMGTVVFPDAICKIFITAGVEARAQRRYKQLIEKGLPSNITTLLQEIGERDARDAGRDVAPLKAAPDALEIDTTTLDVAVVLAQVLAYCRSRLEG